MGIIYRCDKCKKILKSRKMFSINIRDSFGIAFDKHYYKDLILCPDCTNESVKIIKKIFPDLNEKK